MENFDFAAQNMFMPLEKHLTTLYTDHFTGFLSSEIFAQLKACAGPKKITVSREKAPDKVYGIENTIYVGRSRENESGDGYIHLEDDHKVTERGVKMNRGPRRA